MNWIINHKKYKSFYFVCNLLVSTAEIMVLSICVFFAYSTVVIQNRDWYQNAVDMETETDLLFREKMNNIFGVLWMAVLFVLLFCIIAVCMFRKMQLEDMIRILGIYIIAGYSQKKIKKMLMFDIGIDFLLSIPFSFFLTNQVIIFLSKGEVFHVMIAIVGSQGLFLRLNIINAIILLIVISIYNQKWLKRKIEMGLASMIR